MRCSGLVAIGAACAAIAACAGSPPPAPAGRIVVALTLDWEGIELAPDGLAALDDLRARIGAAVPITHFVSAAYATKDNPPGAAARFATTLARAVHPGDELAVHLHVWRSLARAAGVEPRLSPSFLSGTDQVIEFGDGDAGFETDLDAYDIPALRAQLRTSRALLAATHLPVSTSFRAGGYLTTPKLLAALGDEGFTVDSSAVDPHQLAASAGSDDDELPRRLAEVWPSNTATRQPFAIRGGAMQPLIELPIAAVVDYVSTADIVRVFDAADARLRADPARDVFVVLAFHLETASDYARELGDALATIRGRAHTADALLYVTIDRAAELARFALAQPAGSS